MKMRILGTAAVLTLLLSAPVAAQSIYLGGGLTFPTGEFGDEDQTAAETGWLGLAGVSFDLNSDLWLFGEGFYGQNNHSDGNEKTNPYGFMAGLGYDIGSGGGLGLYLFGGIGMMVHKYTNDDDSAQSDSETNFGYEGGVGIGIPLSDTVGWFVEGRYMGATETTFIGLLTGLSITVGG